MAAIDKLLKYLSADNVADFLDDEERKEIVTDVVTGYEIDEESRRQWLETNKQAMKVIKSAEKDENDPERDFPFYKSSSVVYPLLGPAVIQLSSRLIEHSVRNGKVGECEVLGKDEPVLNPQTGQPTGLGIKETKAQSVSDYLNYCHLIKSDTWLIEQHKICTIVASWGMGFKRLYYDDVTKECCSELLQPEDVIINHNTLSLAKCRRITLRNYLTKNDIITNIRSGKFLDVDLELLETEIMENEDQKNDPREMNKIYEIYEQFCYADLDDDELSEPYWITVHAQSKTLLGIQTAFEINDIQINDKGKILRVLPRHNIVDFHLMDDPEGKYYSLGLNHLLIHINKSITAVLRQLLDAGTLANQQGGFVTKAFKTKERSLRFKLGEFKVIETSPGIDPRQQIIPLPFKEPSQVLLALLEVLINSGKEMGFMTDILTGDGQTQNVPATTTLAMIEQGTRAFKPVIQKFSQSEKKEFKIWFHYNSKYLENTEYFQFNGKDVEISKEDFNEKSLDISPVADPTMSSEAHKYARLQAMLQFIQMAPGATNLVQAATKYYTDLQFTDVDALVAQPQPPPPDPKMLDVQRKTKVDEHSAMMDKAKLMVAGHKADNDTRKVDLKEEEVQIKIQDAKVKQAKVVVDAHKDQMDAVNMHNLTEIEKYNAETERKRVNQLETPQSDKRNSSSS